jgi:hypothetical protein
MRRLFASLRFEGDCGGPPFASPDRYLELVSEKVFGNVYGAKRDSAGAVSCQMIDPPYVGKGSPLGLWTWLRPPGVLGGVGQRNVPRRDSAKRGSRGDPNVTGNWVHALRHGAELWYPTAQEALEAASPLYAEWEQEARRVADRQREVGSTAAFFG